MTGKLFRTIGAVALSLAVVAVAAPDAEARRGGSIGSRGSRTYTAPRTTNTAPQQTAPVQRSTAQRPTANQAGVGQQGMAGAKKSGGLAKGLLGGLVAGGLLGMLMGGGLGALGGSGMIMALIQIALIVGAGMMLMRFLRRRSSQQAPASAFSGSQTSNVSSFNSSFGQNSQNNAFTGHQANEVPQQAYPSQNPFAAAAQAAPEPVATTYTRDIEITNADKETFERLLTEIQDGYGREDYTILRATTTPEIMAYFAEEINENAERGLRNNVSRTELLEAEVAEAWNENGEDYATIAMKYQSIDIMLDRRTGAVTSGNPDVPTTTTELWTFVRTAGSPWRLSAIQEA